MPRLYRGIAVLRSVEPVVTMLAIAPAVAVLLVKLFSPKRTTIMPTRAALFLIVSLALGPGLLVNTVLKDHKLAVPQLPVNVVDPPSYETLESMIESISARYTAPAPTATPDN